MGDTAHDTQAKSSTTADKGSAAGKPADDTKAPKPKTPGWMTPENVADTKLKASPEGEKPKGNGSYAPQVSRTKDTDTAVPLGGTTRGTYNIENMSPVFSKPAAWSIKQTAGDRSEPKAPELVENALGGQNQSYHFAYGPRMPGSYAFDTILRYGETETVVDQSLYVTPAATAEVSMIESRAKGTGALADESRTLPVTHQAQLGEEVAVRLAIGAVDAWNPADLHVNYQGVLQFLRVDKHSDDEAEVVFRASALGSGDSALHLSFFDTPAGKAISIPLPLEVVPMNGIDDHGSVDSKGKANIGRAVDLEDALGNHYGGAIDRLYTQRTNALGGFLAQTDEKDPPPEGSVFDRVVISVLEVALGAATAGLGAHIATHLMEHFKLESEGLQELLKVTAEEHMKGVLELAKPQADTEQPKYGYGRRARFYVRATTGLAEDKELLKTNTTSTLRSIAQRAEKKMPLSGARMVQAAAEDVDQQSTTALADQTHRAVEAWSTLSAHESLGENRGALDTTDVTNTERVAGSKHGKADVRLPADPTAHAHAEGVLSLRLKYDGDGHHVVAARINGLRNKALREQLRTAPLAEWHLPIAVSEVSDAPAYPSWVFVKDEAGAITMDAASEQAFRARSTTFSPQDQARAILETLSIPHDIDIDGAA